MLSVAFWAGQMALRMAFLAPWWPKVGQDGHRMAPRCETLGPRWPKMLPRWAQDAAQWVPSWCKIEPRGASWCQDVPKMRHSGAQMV